MGLQHPPQQLGPTLAVFSSHAWIHGYHRADLHRVLSTEWIKGDDFLDLSVPREHPIHDSSSEGALFDVLRDRIAISDVLLVFAGMYANDRTWMEREVCIARTLRVPIIAVAPFGQQRLSSTATGLASEVVRWRGDSIRKAILDHLPEDRRRAFENKISIRAIAQALARPAHSLGALSGFQPRNGLAPPIFRGLPTPPRKPR